MSQAVPIVKDDSRPRETLDFPIVGVGASAGGSEAFEQLLRHLPSDAGLAVIFVQHLSPEHGSSLVEILPRTTKMPVHEARDGMQIERNHVYVIPPNRDLAALHGALHLMSRPQSPARHMPVDYLLRGRSETIGTFADLFSLVDREQKIYAKKQVPTRLPPDQVSALIVGEHGDSMVPVWYRPTGGLAIQWAILRRLLRYGRRWLC